MCLFKWQTNILICISVYLVIRIINHIRGHISEKFESTDAAGVATDYSNGYYRKAIIHT